MNKKKIVFLTGTRADFGKLKSLIKIAEKCDDFCVYIYATGMHMNAKYGRTVDEIYKSGFKNIFEFINHDTIEHMDRTLAKTIEGFSFYVSDIQPDLIVVHGDRTEALAGAIVGSLNNILVAHIEGGEISGTVDELIRHAVTKLSHVHLVANEEAKKRLVQLGEHQDSIWVIGSPDLDLMNPKSLPNLNFVMDYYGLNFKKFALGIFHPITTEYKYIKNYVSNFVDALINTGHNYVLIYPNNDIGSIEILQEFERLNDNDRFKIFPSLRFEYFLTLLRNCTYIVGNSSAGIREAPYYNVPSIDIGTRQQNRATFNSIFKSGYKTNDILQAIEKCTTYKSTNDKFKDYFGEGQSDKMFLKLLENGEIWKIKHQKQFQDIK